MKKIFIFIATISLTSTIWSREIIDRGQKYEISMPARETQFGASSVMVAKDTAAITLNKWNGESSIGVSCPQFGRTTSVRGESIEWSLDRATLSVVGLDRSTAAQEGGIEVQIKFDVRPASNVFRFQLANYQDYDFFYQPPLSDEDRSNDSRVSTCTATDCFDNLSAVVRHRPENVVGSYAVYHKTKRDHLFDQINYETGKVYHIYRPKMIDANGDSIWAVQTIDLQAGVLEVTVPQRFINLAAYPILLDPTIGTTSLGGSTDNQNNFLGATKFSAPVSGNANTGTFYLGGSCSASCSGAPLTAMVAVYADSGSNPDGKAKLSGDASITMNSLTAQFWPGTITWNGIVGGSNYWLSDNGQNVGGVGTNVSYDSTSNTSYYRARTHANDMPDPWGTNSGSFTGFYSYYVDYTASPSANRTIIRGFKGPLR